jgi:hypothetical protein
MFPEAICATKPVLESGDAGIGRIDENPNFDRKHGSKFGSVSGNPQNMTGKLADIRFFKVQVR